MLLTLAPRLSTIKWSDFSHLESYVQFPVPQITMVLLLHMAFGCCMHHAHTCEVNCCQEPAAMAEACDCSTHEHPGYEDDGSNECAEPADHPPNHHCSGEHCTFLQCQRLPELLCEFAADFCPLEAVLTGCDVRVFRSEPDYGQGPPILHAGTSLRTHLALHVLLI
jgi:hypothetical protein